MKPVPPEVANAAVPLGRELFKLELGMALIDAGRETLAVGNGIAPVDPAPEDSVASSENEKALKDPSRSSSVVLSSVMLELGVGTEPETVTEAEPVGAGTVILADSNPPVESSIEADPDTETTAVPSGAVVFALIIDV